MASNGGTGTWLTAGATGPSVSFISSGSSTNSFSFEWAAAKSNGDAALKDGETYRIEYRCHAVCGYDGLEQCREVQGHSTLTGGGSASALKLDDSDGTPATPTMTSPIWEPGG